MDKRKILAIDDEEFFRNIYEEILSSYGFSVLTVENGRKGFDALKKESFDIVITDLAMPGWDGIRTMEEIRKANPGQDIIVVTHITDLETAAAAMRAGASDYILKPLEGENLLHAVRRLLKRQKILYEHSKLVKESIEYFEILSIYKRCMDILSINEYERLVDSIVAALVAETKAKKGLFWLSDGDIEGNWKIIGSMGEISPDDRILPIDDPSWKENVTGGTPFFRSADKMDTFYVPIMPEGKEVGVIELSGKAGRGKFRDKDLKVAGIIAEFSQVALNNAQRILSSEQRAYIDEDFGVFTYNFYMDFLKKEIYLSSRYKRPFSIAYLKVSNIGDLREKLGGNVTRAGIGRMIKKVIEIIREPDIIAKKDPGEYYILFPETDYFGSLMAVKRIEKGITGSKYISDGEISMPVNLLIRSASFPRDGDGIDSLLENVKKSAEKSKNSIYHRFDLYEKGFRESVDMLLSDVARAAVDRDRENGKALAPTTYSNFSTFFYSSLCNSFVDEVLLRPFLRGMLFLGMETVSPKAPLCKKIAGIENLSTRVFIMGKRGEEEWNIPNITPVYLKDGEKPLNVIIFLNEDGGYSFLGKRVDGDSIRSFHTSDVYLVEKLISKLQDHYFLQWI